MTEKSFHAYQEAIDWIQGLVPFGIRPGLERLDVMLDELGHPERRLKFIHVAGTNGKGSVCAYLTQLLSLQGYTVGTFTSPYLDKFTNRICTNNEAISEQQVLDWANVLAPMVANLAAGPLGSPTMFEVVTVIALLHFARESYPDFVVWETGLGGRLDCTNVVHPLVSIITNIGYDHMDILGDTLPAIATEKAGIIKPGVPVVSAVEQPDVVDVIRATATDKRSTLYLMGEQFGYVLKNSSALGSTFDFHGPFRDLSDLEISMVGEHQVKNAVCALMALEVMRQYYALVTEDELEREALHTTTWAGRLELVQTKPRLLLDGAHNPEGAHALANALRTAYSYEKLHAVMGMLETKDQRGTLAQLLPLLHTLIVTEPVFRKKCDAAKLAAVAKQVQAELGTNVTIIVQPEWQQALAHLKELANDADLALVTGTLYLISDARAYLLQGGSAEKGW
jgi:dihydrofolate synthase/folylpolyglutamate synthase